jgi:hypothetical protein
VRVSELLPPPTFTVTRKDSSSDRSALMLRRGGRSGAGHSREHYGDGLPVAHAPPLVPEQRRRSLGLPVLQESSQVCIIFKKIAKNAKKCKKCRAGRTWNAVCLCCGHLLYTFLSCGSGPGRPSCSEAGRVWWTCGAPLCCWQAAWHRRLQPAHVC